MPHQSFYDPWSGGGYAQPTINWGDWAEYVFSPRVNGRSRRQRTTADQAIQQMAALYREQLALYQAHLTQLTQQRQQQLTYASYEPRRLPWGRDLVNMASGVRNPLLSVFAYLLSKAKAIPRRAPPSGGGPRRRFARGVKKGKEITGQRNLDDMLKERAKAPQPKAPGGQLPDWLQAILAMTGFQAVLEAISRDKAGKTGDSWQDERDRRLERERDAAREERERQRFQHELEDRKREAEERAAAAEEKKAKAMGEAELERRREQEKREAAAAAAAAAAPKPLWLQVLGGAQEYLTAQQQRPRGTSQVVTFPDFEPFPSPGLTPFEFGGVGSRTQPGCECPPKKKRGPRKKRTVCYTGRFIERQDGTTKYQKRRTPCRPSRKKPQSRQRQ